MQGANFWKADLTGAKDLTLDQLLQVKTLYEVKGLDSDLEQQLRAQQPELFERSSLLR